LILIQAIHGAKNDSKKTAALLEGGLLPQAYVNPPEMRATRDLLRRRLHFVRHRGQLLAHIQNTHHQYNRSTPAKRIAYRTNREGIAKGFEDGRMEPERDAESRSRSRSRRLRRRRIWHHGHRHPALRSLIGHPLLLYPIREDPMRSPGSLPLPRARSKRAASSRYPDASTSLFSGAA
jgi:hypothetical protein